MKKLCIFAIAAVLSLGSLFTLHAKDNEASSVKPHYEIRNKEFWKYLHTDSLPDINKGKVKTYTVIINNGDDEFESDAVDVYTYNFNKNGLQTSGSYKGIWGDSYEYKIELNEYGRPAKIHWVSKDICLDCENTDITVETDYIPFYDRAGRINLIREETMKVGGKKANQINKYYVQPGPTGAPAMVVCLEDQSLFLNFSPDRNLKDCKIYIYGFEDMKVPEKWYLLELNENQTREMIDMEVENNIPANAVIEYDAKGNWSKKSWKNAGGNDVSIRREIVYF